MRNPGPYDVGYTLYKSKQGNDCAIYYPINKGSNDGNGKKKINTINQKYDLMSFQNLFKIILGFAYTP